MAEITEAMLEYLDRLRKSGVTNMFGATPYLRMEYPSLTQDEARKVLAFWMKTFSQRHPKSENENSIL